jgi:hypothetical protein
VPLRLFGFTTQCAGVTSILLPSSTKKQPMQQERGLTNMNLLLRLVAVAALSVCFALQSRAQTSGGTISGHIIDQSQAIVANAEVKLVNQQTGVIVTTQVRPNGDFIFADVQPRTFTVLVKAPGYKELRQVNLRLDASQSLSAGTLTLQIGALSQQVTVTAEITPLQTTSAERSACLITPRWRICWRLVVMRWRSRG